MIYAKRIERISIEARPDFGDKSEITIMVRDGWNDSCPLLYNRLSREELRDLRYLIDRALVAIEQEEAKS